ncbi:hypothetical protein BGZ46_005003, partial [Entomortierella lignicola]
MDSEKENDIHSDKNKSNYDKNSNTEDSNCSLREEVMAWFQEKVTHGQEISMPDFCEKFRFTCERDAHAAFLNPLATSLIPYSTRTAVCAKYETWRRNEGAKYWASRIADYKIDVSTNKTVEDLVDRGQFFTRRLLKKRPRDESEGSQSSMLPRSLHKPTTTLTTSQETPNTTDNTQT